MKSSYRLSHSTLSVLSQAIISIPITTYCDPKRPDSCIKNNFEVTSKFKRWFHYWRLYWSRRRRWRTDLSTWRHEEEQKETGVQTKIVEEKNEEAKTKYWSMSNRMQGSIAKLGFQIVFSRLWLAIRFSQWELPKKPFKALAAHRHSAIVKLAKSANGACR